jgi:hypothetical protein
LGAFYQRLPFFDVRVQDMRQKRTAAPPRWGCRSLSISKANYSIAQKRSPRRASRMMVEIFIKNVIGKSVRNTAASKAALG